MKKYILIKQLLNTIFLFLLFISHTVFSQQSGIKIIGKLNIVNGNTDHAKIELFKNGKKIKTFNGNEKIKMQLERNNTYCFKFSKKHYITKSAVFIVENISDERWDKGFTTREFIIDLYEQDEKNIVVNFVNPVVVFKYDQVMDEFFEVTDYSTSKLQKIIGSDTSKISETVIKKDDVSKDKKSQENSGLTIDSKEKVEIKDKTEAKFNASEEARFDTKENIHDKMMNENKNIVEKKEIFKYGNSLTDIDGNIYKTIYIGTQLWMDENLKTTKFNDGTIINLVTNDSDWSKLSTSAYCWYGNNISYKKIYGNLYNWYTVETGKLCPSGWHVPDDVEWTILSKHLGVMSGGRLKESGTFHWYATTSDVTNDSKFTALPGGSRFGHGNFSGLRFDGFWWSSTIYKNDYAWCRYLYFKNAEIGRNNAYKTSGFSVRCVKD